MRDVFFDQPTRHFIHGFFMHGSKMELYVFNQSGPYSSGKSNIHEEPERFVQSLGGYAHMSDEELGFDTFLKCRAAKSSVTIERDDQGQKREIQHHSEPFVKQKAIVCQGTTCFRMTDHKSVIKFS